MPKVLAGMKDIRLFLGKYVGLGTSESSVIASIQKNGFPAKKLGGIWVSHEESIEEWYKKFCEGETMNAPAAKKQNGKKRMQEKGMNYNKRSSN